MASRRFGLSAAVEIPPPEEDDMSEDEFDGYVDPDEAPFESGEDLDGEESEADDDVPSIPGFNQPTGPVTGILVLRILVRGTKIFNLFAENFGPVS